MPRIKTVRHAASAAGIVVSGRHAPLPRKAVEAAAARVLAAEGRPARLSITFLGARRMQALNEAWKGAARPTDVLAFALAEPSGDLLGDIYICPWVAAREARALGIPLRRELLRLVVHGVLHVLGYDHPEGAGRLTSSMWRRQERYLRGLR
ncbi:MAG: rRNA maturation RNase YbeY [Gemmatimonadales bacterium]|nr:rRNA maturation RNase YbeY [Gemmatimonadales bacterium]